MARPSTRARCSFALNRATGTNSTKPRINVVQLYTLIRTALARLAQLLAKVGKSECRSAPRSFLGEYRSSPFGLPAVAVRHAANTCCTRASLASVRRSSSTCWRSPRYGCQTTLPSARTLKKIMGVGRRSMRCSSKARFRCDSYACGGRGCHNFLLCVVKPAHHLGDQQRRANVKTICETICDRRRLQVRHRGGEDGALALGSVAYVLQADIECGVIVRRQRDHHVVRQAEAVSRTQDCLSLSKFLNSRVDDWRSHSLEHQW